MPAMRSRLGLVAAKWLVPCLFFLLALGSVDDGPIASIRSHVLRSDLRETRVEDAIHARLSESYARLPMSFEANTGQTDAQVQFLSRGNGYRVFLTSTEAVFSLTDPAQQKGRKDAPAGRTSGIARPAPELDAVMRLTLVGAKPPKDVTGLDRLAGKSHYFIGNNPTNWHTDVPTYARVEYKDVYPGVDLVYHGGQGQLEYDFVVAPGADPARIRLRFDGVTDRRIDDDGSLIMRLGEREFRERKPVIYQEVHGRRHNVGGGYVQNGNGEIGFEVDAYDRQEPLIIDPIIVYSTYLGGSTGGLAGSFGEVIALGSDGSMFVAGNTTTVDFPTVNPPQASNAGDVDLFVSKISADGSALVFSTYLGGSGSEGPITLALDAAENVYVHGGTVSPDFPTTPGAFRSSGRGAFVVKLNPQGSALIYSTLAFGDAAAVDSAGNVYLIGETDSPRFVFRNPLQATLAGGVDAIIGKLNLDGSEIVYLTYFGGSGDDAGRGITVDAAGNINVEGFTKSPDFPTLNPIQASYAGGQSYGDCWVAKMTSDGSALLYSTYLGGSEDDVCTNIAVDPQGHAHVGGQTWSTDFPVFHAFQSFLKSPRDAIVAKLDQSGSSLIYSTYVGGSGEEVPTALTVDEDGNAYLVGVTASTDFPTYRALQSHLGAQWDAFLVKIDPTGAPTYSTYLEGGSQGSTAKAVAADAAGTAYVTGFTASADFPTKHALQPALAGATDAIIVKIADPPCPEDVTGQVDIFKFPVHRILFTPFRFQWVVIRNQTAAPIVGPLAFVMDDLQRAVFVGSALKTHCFSPEGDPLTVITAGTDDVLSPSESVVTVLWFFKTQFGPIIYTPHVLSGIPTQ
jgi:hypothetical protein